MELTLSKHFDTVAEEIKKFGSGMGNEDKAKLYGLFKQANFGDNTAEQPSFYQLEAKGKWTAWEAEKGKSSDQAKHEYVEHALKFFPEEEKAKYA